MRSQTWPDRAPVATITSPGFAHLRKWVVVVVVVVGIVVLVVGW